MCVVGLGSGRCSSRVVCMTEGVCVGWTAGDGAGGMTASRPLVAASSAYGRDGSAGQVWRGTRDVGDWERRMERRGVRTSARIKAR